MTALTPTPVLSNYYLHYTSHLGAQNIVAAGCIRPARSGRIYLTKDLYLLGADAAEKLSILNKPVELACLIHDESLSFLEGPFPIEPIRDDSGKLASAWWWY